MRVVVAMLGMCLGAVGCGRANLDSPAQAESPAKDVTLQVLDYDGIQKLIASHRGKIVVMDAWSTSCPPCVKEFPNLVKLSQKYPDQIACISLSFDNEGLTPLDEVKKPVLEFLRQQGATFDNVLSSDESDALYRKMDLVAVPAVFVYDAEGNLSKRFDNGSGVDFTYADVEKHLSEMLAK